MRVVETISKPAGTAIDEPDTHDLMARLTRAYLSGDGAEVERLMALMAGGSPDTDPSD